MNIAIIGPTGTGKSDAAIALAERLDGEIVSADSMLVYRGMDIGTAKPSTEDRLRVPHHLIDIVDPGEEYNVVRYQNEALQVISEIHRRGRSVILVGGTGFYVRAAIDDFDFPLDAPPSPELREEMLDYVRREGEGALHARLSQLDPDAAGRIHPQNVKRVIRAIEIAVQTDRPVAPFPSPRDVDRASTVRYNWRVFGLCMSRTQLYALLDARVDRMINAGILDEVRALKEAGVPSHVSSQQALGYRQIRRYLDGETDLDSAISIWKRDTRRFAKRQMTWFRKDPRVDWVNVDAYVTPEDTAEHLLRRLAETEEVHVQFAGEPARSVSE